MAFNSYISLIKGKLGAKTPEVAVETTEVHAGDTSHTRPAAGGLILDAVSPHDGEAQDGSGTDNANLGDTATHEHRLIGITTEVEPVELLENARGHAPSDGYNLGDTATHERGSGGSAHSILTEFTFPNEQLSSDHGGVTTTDESPPLGETERVLAAQGSGSDEQVLGVTEYGTTDVGHTGGVFSFKSSPGMDSETERLAFSSERGSGPSGGVQKFDGAGVWSAEGGHPTGGAPAVNDQTPADWNERSAESHNLKTEWITEAVVRPGPVHGEAVQDIFVTEAVARPEAESDASVFGEGGGVDDRRPTDLRISADGGQNQGFTARFDGGMGPHDTGHDVKWEGPDYDAARNAFAGPRHEGLVMPFVEQNAVVDPGHEGIAILPHVEAQDAVEDEPTLERMAPGSPGHEELANSVSSLDSDADAPATLLGDLHHGDQLYTGVNDGSLLGMHDPVGHVDPGHHDLNDVHHGHDAALDHLHHVDIDLGQ